MRRPLARLLATGLYSGYSPLVPGTVGSVPAWLIGYFVIGERPYVMAAVILFTFVVSVWSATETEKLLGHDARKIVIDEWVGMFIAFLLVPVTLTNYLIAFVAFRFFDVVKLPPASQAERLPGGWGVTMDDVVAGVQANIVTQVILLFVER